MTISAKALWLHFGILALLFALNFVLPEYHRGIFSRVMVLAVFAMGYNLAYGYTGLLSLGHAMFFAAGLYGAGLTIYHLDWSVWPALLAGLTAGAILAVAASFLALRTAGVAFMIVTLMFAQVFYLATLYFTTYTRGEEGLVLPQSARVLSLPGIELNLTDPGTRYMVALALFATVLFSLLFLVRSSFGRTLVAIRESEERMRMLGYDVFTNKLSSMTISALICAAAGAAYAILFGYAGSSFASIQYSILPLLWVLLGGAATTLGPVVGTFFMFYAVDIASGYTSAYMLVVGLALILLVLYFPRGIAGTARERWLPWLP
ncbi:branched-chain amino acid ABC transporter permease [Chelativorans sp. AA-79]|uniref:branched-chain amino acid ABC transporter permease n=1 Tax=Chelativorans sp. AA-79 TaxID=3028735 RepID=UPI0023F9D148|nr:branched-chain amino acid ABC transporter permease [Chelativorans sp. AA-79]WEX09624.1 branched-chain amino acid ABC transporter permease [Chelativorans sp. AA-79]